MRFIEKTKKQERRKTERVIILPLDKTERKPIADGRQVRLKECGNIVEIMASESRSQGGYITKLNADEYVDNRTGEIFEFKHNENRANDLSNVAKSLQQGRDILNTNITDVSKCRWLTLTYADNMTDGKKLYTDFDNFNRRAREKWGHYEYITCAEPQGRGAWHLHCVLIFPNKAPFMANKDVADCWKQGFVTIKKLDDVDNVGAYLTAYLGDMEMPDKMDEKMFRSSQIKEVELTDENGKKLTKKYIKGARLSMYPSGFHIFRWSKGIKKPNVTMTNYAEAKEKVNGGTLTYSKGVMLFDEASDFSNTLLYEYYNTIRKPKCQDKM